MEGEFFVRGGDIALPVGLAIRGEAADPASAIPRGDASLGLDGGVHIHMRFLAGNALEGFLHRLAAGEDGQEGKRSDGLEKNSGHVWGKPASYFDNRPINSGGMWAVIMAVASPYFKSRTWPTR